MPAAPAPSPSAERPAAEQFALVESFDNFSRHRRIIAAMAREAKEWAGIPMPLEGEQLVVEPSYKFAALFNGDEEEPVDVGDGQAGPRESEDDLYRVVNMWHSRRHRSTVAVAQNGRGRAQHVFGLSKQIDLDLRTLGCSEAWGVEQEHRALNLLGTMLNHRMFKAYLLTGMFLETSKRSGVVYLFRKLRPTIAIKAMTLRWRWSSRPWLEDGDGYMKPLAALCMHPIAYYADSWAGAMCPTDDVVAHLAMMRGDEVMFWRRCNQHDPFSKEAGL